MIFTKNILVFFLWGILSAPHPLHLSVCNIDISEKDNRMDISLRIFADDLEEAVYRETGQEVNIQEGNAGNGIIDSLIDSYIQKSFVLTLNGRKVEVLYDKGNLSDDAFVIKYIVKEIPGRAIMRVENKVFFDLFDDQKNLVFVNIGDKSKGFNLDSKESLIEFSY